MVKYIEDQEKALKHLLDNIHANEKNLLEYNKQQKKYLLDYEKKQKEYVIDYQKKQKKYLLEYEKNHKKSLVEEKKDKKHKPKVPQYPSDNIYNVHPDKKPIEVVPIPLPPSLPNYEIQHNTDKGYQTNYPKSDHIPIENGNVYPDNSILPYFPHTIDPNYPPGSQDNLNPQFTDPFHSWTTSNPRNADFFRTRSVKHVSITREACV